MGIPDLFEDLVARAQRARIARQQGQQVELLAGQGQLVAVEQHAPGALVDLELAVDQHVAGRLVASGADVGPPGHGADAGHQLSEAEGLDHVVVGAQLEADHPVDLLAAGGDDDDRHVGLGAEPAAHLVAVHVGQAEVEQHEIDGARLQGHLERGPPGGDPPGRVALAPEALDQRLGDGVVVFDQEELHPARMPGRRAADVTSLPCLYLGVCGPWWRGSYGWAMSSSPEPLAGRTLARRPALALASAAAVVIVAALAALAANLGLLRTTSASAEKVGKLDAANVVDLVGVTPTTSVSVTMPPTSEHHESDAPGDHDRDADD